MTTERIDVLAVFDAELGIGTGASLEEIKLARAAVAELIEAAKEDAEKPFNVVLNYRADRKPEEPEGVAWWREKRAALEADGYSMATEYDNGEELFTRDGSTDRLLAALARVGGA